MKKTILPQDLNSSLGSENKDFVLKAHNIHPSAILFGLIGFGVLGGVGLFAFVFTLVIPFFQGKEVHFVLQGIPTVVSIDNPYPFVMAIIVVGFFCLEVYEQYFKKRDYFVGTPTRLLHFRKSTRSIPWEQFSGHVEVTGNAKKGNILLQMRTGKVVSKNGTDRHVPDVIHMYGIPNAFEIERMCKKRMKENGK